MVRTGRADLAHLGVVRAEANATASGVRSTSRIDAAGVREQVRLGARAERREQRSARSPPRPAAFDPQAEAARSAARSIARAARPTNSIVASVALLAGPAPGDEPVLVEQHRAGGRVLLEQPRDPARHVEARPLVVEPDRSRRRSPRSASVAPFRRRGERDHRVGMGVVDLGAPERTRAAASRSTVAAGPARARSARDSRPSPRRPSLPLAQREQLVEPQAGEAGGSDRREIGSGALDPEHAGLTAGMVDDRSLRRGIAAADVRQRAVGAEEIRAVDERRRGRRGPPPARSSHRSLAAPGCRAAGRRSTSLMRRFRADCGRSEPAKRSRASCHALEPAGS